MHESTITEGYVSGDDGMGSSIAYVSCMGVAEAKSDEEYTLQDARSGLCIAGSSRLEQESGFGLSSPMLRCSTGDSRRMAPQ